MPLAALSLTSASPTLTTNPSSNSFTRSVSTKKGTWQKVSEYANLFFYCTISIFFAYLGTNIFAVGFVGGLVYNEEAARLVKRVNHIFNSINFKQGVFIGFFTITFIHIVFVAAAFYKGVSNGEFFTKQIN